MTSHCILLHNTSLKDLPLKTHVDQSNRLFCTFNLTSSHFWENKSTFYGITSFYCSTAGSPKQDFTFLREQQSFYCCWKSWALDLLICCSALFYFERWRTKHCCTICARKTHSWNSQNHNFHDWQQKQSPVIFGYKLYVAWCILAIEDIFF